MRKQANGSANKVGSDALKSSLFLLSGADKILRQSTFTVFQLCKSTTIPGKNELMKHKSEKNANYVNFG